MNSNDPTAVPSVLIDGVQAMGVHKDVARLLLVQIQPDGKSRPQLQLQVPKKVLKAVIDALQKAAT